VTRLGEPDLHAIGLTNRRFHRHGIPHTASRRTQVTTRRRPERSPRTWASR
jgi:hypothetical protein